MFFERKQQKPYMVKLSQANSDPADCESLHSQLVVLCTTASVHRGYTQKSFSCFGTAELASFFVGHSICRSGAKQF